MIKKLYLPLLMALVVALSSCNKKMGELSSDYFTTTPQVLEAVAGKVPVTINGKFPEKYFNKKAVVEVTPVLRWNGGEAKGQPAVFQGEKVEGNDQTISYKVGGNYTMKTSFDYVPEMAKSELYLEFNAKIGNKTVTIPAVKIADGVIATATMVNNAPAIAIGADQFERITKEEQEAAIYYLINSAQIRTKEMSSKEIKAMEKFIKDAKAAEDMELKNIQIQSYASPDGPVKFNDELSKARSESGQEAISKALEGVDAKYDIAAYGEDWEGFKELVAASDIKDKDLILQVLAMTDNPVQRDQEIKNMTSVFEVLAEEILPQLRRTKLVADVDIEGRTDAEIQEAAANNIDVLSEEEMLYAATLTDDLDAQLKAYEAAASKYNSVRGYNNAGVVLAKQGKVAQAKTQIEKAAGMSKDAAITNNLGVIALMEGDAAAAQKYFSALNTPDAKANMGLVNLAEGNYSEATKSLSGYNLAVAEVMNGNLSKAKSLLANENSADADYLKAVIAMREGNTSSAISNLKSAIAKDPAKKGQAVKDIEFSKLFGTTEFLAL